MVNATKVTPATAVNVIAVLSMGDFDTMAERVRAEVMQGWYSLPFDGAEMFDIYIVTRKMAAFDESKRAAWIAKLEAFAAKGAA
jgi:hypothetical protein